MCIRDRSNEPLQLEAAGVPFKLYNPSDYGVPGSFGIVYTCLLYTSDAADERSSVDLGGRRIIKKKKHDYHMAARAVRERGQHDSRKYA